MSAPLALSMGDPAGVGPEITVAAWRSGQVADPFYLISDPAHIRRVAGDGGVPVAEIADPSEAPGRCADALPVLTLELPVPPRPGEPDPANAESVIRSIEMAFRHARSGAAAAIVTNPINKRGLKEGAGFAFPGHTEFLADLAGIERPVMMLAAPGIRVVPTTIHVPLAEVPALLTADLLEETIRITEAALRRDFGIVAPRIAVAGLNPHAGEGGVLGAEEGAFIAPLLDRLRGEGMDIAGPLPADTMFHPAARARYDVAVCMYHDQALIPIKTIDFARGVNVTLGLPVVRTSPDHGTAYDIAGKGIADPTSLIEALNLAGEMARARNG